MNRKEAAELLPIIQAYAEGKEIEIFDKTMKMWKTAMLPHFDCDSNIYRIKPERKYAEPKYHLSGRPFYRLPVYRTDRL